MKSELSEFQKFDTEMRKILSVSLMYLFLFSCREDSRRSSLD